MLQIEIVEITKYSRQTMPARKNAKLFLHNLLVNGPVRATVATELALAAGHRATTLTRAKRSLNILVEKRGPLKGEWYWTLPTVVNIK